MTLIDHHNCVRCSTGKVYQGQFQKKMLIKPENFSLRSKRFRASSSRKLGSRSNFCALTRLETLAMQARENCML